jgi:hypothetical protein
VLIHSENLSRIQDILNLVIKIIISKKCSLHSDLSSINLRKYLEQTVCITFMRKSPVA